MKKKALIESIEKEASKLRESILDEGKKKAHLVKIKMISDAKMEQKRQIESKKEEIITNCIREIKEELSLIREDQKKYKDLLRAYIDDAKNQLGDDITILCDPKDSTILSNYNIPKKETLSTMGGIIVTSFSSKIQLDYRFETIFNAKEQDIRQTIAKNIFM